MYFKQFVLLAQEGGQECMHACMWTFICFCVYGWVTGCVHAACVLACVCVAIPTDIIV